MPEREFNKIFSERLRYYLNKYEMTQLELSKRLGVGTTSVYNWTNGIKTPRMDKVDAMCKIFNCKRSDLMEDPEQSIPTASNIRPISRQRLPVLGKIACGVPKYAAEDRESYVLEGAAIDADFCLIASGDSMVNARIHDGDIVFIRQQSIVDNGDIAAVIVNDAEEATLKRFFYYREQALMILRAENPTYEDQVYSGEQLNQVVVLGKAVAFQSDVK